MKQIHNRALALAGIALAFTSLQASAADGGPYYGSPATFGPHDQEVCVGADTKSVTVRRLDIVRFVTTDGRDFYWRFDTERPDVFPLARIAPSGVAVPSSTTVYILPEFAISP